VKVSIYSTAWGITSPTGFDFPGALANWAVYADEISIACGDDETYRLIKAHADERGYPVKLTRTSFDFTSDSFAYGKTENAALQACTGDLLIQQNLDERFRADKSILTKVYEAFQSNPGISTFMIPTIDLYGSLDRYVAPIKTKWYLGRPGYFRGPVKWGIKSDGRPRYETTSTDEWIDKDGNLGPAASLISDLSIESVRAYVAAGYPLVYHLGFVNLQSRAKRAEWWANFWKMATSGDPNSHITDIAELERKHTFEHRLPLWPSKSPPV